MNETFDETAIKVLSIPEAIRRRPGMYLPQDCNIRNTLLLEALCLSLSEAHCGTCTAIAIETSGRSAMIADNGLGLSLEKGSDGTTFAQNMLTQLYSCRNHKAHRELAMELCGAGIVVVNALSELLVVEIHSAGTIKRQSYRHAISEGPFQVINQTSRTGTTLRFTIAEEFAGVEEFDVTALRDSIFAKQINLSRTKVTINERPRPAAWSRARIESR